MAFDLFASGDKGGVRGNGRAGIGVRGWQLRCVGWGRAYLVVFCMITT